MKIALDPYMFRRVPLTDLPGLVADLGYSYIELSPREDFLPFFLHPRADKAQIAAFSKALDAAGVQVASVLPLYRWSGPDEDERQAAVRYWKRAIQVTADLGVDVMNSEFNGRPEAAPASEAQFWRSMEELLPVFEREGIRLVLEPHPDDFIEDGRAAIDLIRGIDSDRVSFLYCAPHTFHQGGDLEGIMKYAGPLLTHLHIADSFDHRASSGLRYIVNPPGSPARIHQHLDIGQGEVDWDAFFRTLTEVRFDGIATVCVFAWEERARESSAHNLEQIRHYLAKHGSAEQVARPLCLPRCPERPGARLACLACSLPMPAGHARRDGATPGTAPSKPVYAPVAAMIPGEFVEPVQQLAERVSGRHCFPVLLGDTGLPGPEPAVADDHVRVSGAELGQTELTHPRHA